MAAQIKSEDEFKKEGTSDDKYSKNKKFHNKYGSKNRNSKYNRGNKRFSRHGDNVTDHATDSVERSPKSKGNDPAWYAYNPDLLRDAYSVPFTYPLGLKVDYANTYYKGNSHREWDRIPGIMTMRLLTGPGQSKDVNSAVNVAARDIYSFVRHANSGHSNYDPNDLMMYILAVDEAYMLYYNACRAYGCMTLYNVQNRYAPRQLVRALGWDYSDLNANLANFRYSINAYAARLNSLNVPVSFPLITRHSWLYSGLYLDGTGPKSQLYAYVPYGYRVYDETVSTGSQLTFKSFTTQAHEWKWLTVENFVTIANEIADALTGSEDIGIISGDILKAFSSGSLFKLPTLDDNYSITPVFDPEVLMQFQNATIQYRMASPVVDTTVLSPYTITQDPSVNQGIIKFNPEFTRDTDFYHENYYEDGANPRYTNARITIQKDVPTVEDTAVATRLTTIAIDDVDGTHTKWHLDNFGSEIAMDAQIWSLTEDGAMITALFPYQTIVRNGADDATLASTTISGTDLWNLTTELDRISQFDYHPLIIFSVGCLAPEATKFWNVYTHHVQDVATYATLTPNVLSNMHDTAILSEFNVPLKYSTL